MTQRHLMAVLVGAGLVASGLAGTSVARAADPPGAVETVVVAADTLFSEGSTGLLASAPPSGPRTPYGDAVERTGFSVTALSASRDGSRTVAIEKQDVVVRDISGRTVRVIGPSAACFDRLGPSLSPDGNLVAWTCSRRDPDNHAGFVRLVRVAPVATGVERTLVVDPEPHVGDRTQFLTNGLLLIPYGFDVRSVTTQGVLGPFVTRINGTRFAARPVSVSPDGSTLVFLGGGNRAVLRTPLSIAGTTVTFGPETAVLTSDAPVLRSPVFSRDGASIWFLRNASSPEVPDVLTVPVTGGTPLPLGLPTPTLAEQEVAVGVREPTAPVAPLSVGPAVLDDAVRIPFVLAPDPTASTLRVTRSAPGVATTVAEIGLPATGPFVDQPFSRVNGRVYSYSFQVVDRSGNVGPTAVVQTDASGRGRASVNQPTSNGSAVPTRFPVSLIGGATGARYTVDYRPLSRSAPWTRWATSVLDHHLLFGTPASPGFAATTARPGTTYYFRIRTEDPFGNVSPLNLSGAAVVPHDQNIASYTGSTATVPRTDSYGGTSTFLRAAGATATASLPGDRIQLVGEKCPTCGEADVLVNGVAVARIDTYRAAKQTRRVIWAATYPTGRTTTVALRAVGTRGRPTVVLDAVAVRTWLPSPNRDLTAGQQLLPGQSLRGAGGIHRFALETNGNLTLRSFSTLRFETGTRTGARLVMQADGNLVLYDAASSPLWSTGTARNPGSVLHLQDDGNLILFRGTDGVPLFSTGRF